MIYEREENNQELLDEFLYWLENNNYYAEDYGGNEYNIYRCSNREEDEEFVCSVDVEESMENIMNQIINLDNSFNTEHTAEDNYNSGYGLSKSFDMSRTQKIELDYLAGLAKEYLETH